MEANAMHLPSVPGAHPLFPQQERNHRWRLWLRAEVSSIRAGTRQPWLYPGNARATG